MQLTKYLKTTGLAAIAVALALPSIATEATAAEQWRNKGDRSAQHQQESRSAERRGMDRPPPQRPERIERRSEQRAERVERRGDRDAAREARRGNYDRAARIDRRSDWRAGQIERNGDQRARDAEARRDAWRDRQQQRDGDRRNWDRHDSDRNRSYRDNDRNRTYRDNDRNRSYRDWQRNQSYRWSDRRHDRDYRRWDNRWRNDRRYNWRDYRRVHRSTFNIGIYYSPYRNYSYRRLNPGYRLDSLFFGSRYWISDPWRYRLPDVYGPYRWVRYYDDVLLVDTFSGEVVDVIHDFFW